jgi:hypothetical protein
LIRPGDRRWRASLPKARELTQEDLNELEEIGPPEVITRLRAALMLIDSEIAEAEKP